MFGAMHIVDVLRGERNEMVGKHRHDALPTFGVGAEHPAGFWRGVIRQLIALGALRTDSGKYASLALVPDAARAILRGETTVSLKVEAPAAAPVRDRSRAAASPSAAETTPEGDASFERLRAWRSAEAKAQSVPPYVIFHDSVLREIAELRPASLEALGRIKGVGASKLDRYGARVLGVLAG
jgi:ATP-dependent DNA helicase RecQ